MFVFGYFFRGDKEGPGSDRRIEDAFGGARPMARLIQSKIKEPLANEILFGGLQDGGQVVVDAKDGELKLEYIGS